MGQPMADSPRAPDCRLTSFQALSAIPREALARVQEPAASSLALFRSLRTIVLYTLRPHATTHHNRWEKLTSPLYRAVSSLQREL